MKFFTLNISIFIIVTIKFLNPKTKSQTLYASVSKEHGN